MWGTPQHSSPWFFGTLGWRGGIRVGEGGPWPISALPANLSLLFSVPPIKSLCSYTHSTGDGLAPRLLGPAPQTGAWTLHPLQSH